MYTLEAHPAAPFTTIAGSTKGPCVNVGVPTVHGAPIYVGEQETRSVLKALGWPAPEAHAAVVAERDAAAEQASALEHLLVGARAQIAALELIVRVHKPEPKPKTVAPKAAV